MSYGYREIPITINDRNLIIEQPYILEYKDNLLDEFVFSVERPLVRVVDNKFVYSTSVIRENKVVSNAFDLLRYIPNMTGTGDNLRLVGTTGYTILIDGKPSTLSKRLERRKRSGIILNRLSTRISPIFLRKDISGNSPFRRMWSIHLIGR